MLTRSDITAHFDRAGARPSRALGQNFVADQNTVRRIVRLAEIGSSDRVVEIGAGLGSLTLALAETGASVTAVEIDRHLIAQLRENVSVQSNVTVVHADAMALDWVTLLPADRGPYVLVANLPYNVATPLVADLLDGVSQIGRMLVMVQKEVAERFAANPRTPAYGAVSVKVAYWATAKVVGTVPASVFVPVPNVDSALARIDRRGVPAVDTSVVGPERLFEVVRAGFANRRKMLRNNLAGIVTPEAFERAGVAPTARAEELDVHAWGRLAER